MRQSSRREARPDPNGAAAERWRIALAGLCGGAAVLFAYGLTVNIPAWDFGRLIGLYIVLLFVVAQIMSWLVVHQPPSLAPGPLRLPLLPFVELGPFRYSYLVLMLQIFGELARRGIKVPGVLACGAHVVAFDFDLRLRPADGVSVTLSSQSHFRNRI
ncbi:MAG TPA: hypothetical protein VHY84_04010 [Bryobacteraceae bacterium]|nr:hypothetical protein [Bryobacteraceae bacterium]